MHRETDYALIGCPALNSVWERAYILCGFSRMWKGSRLTRTLYMPFSAKSPTSSKRRWSNT